ncbi:MAG TPA: HAD family phosphatase [Bacteroidales bacterium]|jgi:HAD superfamily hydrolase (TIGR01509 family)|nr:HAD family phosphatase [Proteiniphilum sp.]HHT34126.1 HAD family phosphatase [Bacteroidales bacterium]
MDIESVFFDMDGVVIESEKLHLQALGMTLEANGISFDRAILDQFVGKSDWSFFQYAYQHLDDRIDIEYYLKEKDLHFESLISDLQFVKGFPGFMRAVKEAKLRTALVTSSTSQTVQKVDKVLHFTHQFDLVITADDTSTHKPSPEPYLLALERTGSNKARTMIIEDSSYGIIAGKAAGCIVCGLTTSFDAAILKDAGADLTSDNYRELHLSLQ